MSRVYDLFVRAMVEEKEVSCVFRGLPRVLSPILLGHREGGKEVALAWQTAGRSTKPLPPKGAWRNITLAEVTEVRLAATSLRIGERFKGQQRWVTDVDLDVNPESPYHPRRRLQDLRRPGKWR